MLAEQGMGGLLVRDEGGWADRLEGGAEDVLLLLAAGHEDALADPTRSRILMRELLDNQVRADTAETWYLRDFLKNLVDTLRRLPEWRDRTRPEALAAIYQILGAINYFAISEPTLRAIFSNRHHNELARKFPAQLRRTIEAVLERA